MTTTGLQPRVLSEVSSRLHATDPTLREFFNLENATLTGAELERLMIAAWTMGYAAACGDIADGTGPYPPLPPLAELFGLEIP